MTPSSPAASASPAAGVDGAPTDAGKPETTPSTKPVGVGPPQPTRFDTIFKYEARFGDGIRTYNENPDVIMPVWLPPEIGWDCHRNVPLVVEGRKRNGFACSNDGWKTNVLLLIGCSTSAVDPTHASGLRLFGPRPDGRPQGEPTDAGVKNGVNPVFGKFVDLATSCETVAVP
jgi:hypothetical protein